jgi:hypothetical protein
MSQLSEIDLFISYQSDIKEHVKKLYGFLKTLDYAVWMDINRLVAADKGNGLNEELAKVIGNSRAFICCITKAYYKNENCKLEFYWARRTMKPLIILMYEKVNIENLNSVGLTIAPLTQINLYKNLKATWDGPKKDELINAILAALSPQALTLGSTFHLNDQVNLSNFRFFI